MSILEINGESPIIELKTMAIWKPWGVTTIAVVRISLEKDQILLEGWTSQPYRRIPPYSKIHFLYPLIPKGIEKAMTKTAFYLSQKGGGKGVLRQLERLAAWFKRNVDLDFNDEIAAKRLKAIIRIFGGHL